MINTLEPLLRVIDDEFQGGTISRVDPRQGAAKIGERQDHTSYSDLVRSKSTSEDRCFFNPQPFITLPNPAVQVLIGIQTIQDTFTSATNLSQVATMSYNKPEKGAGEGPVRNPASRAIPVIKLYTNDSFFTPFQQIHKIRITLTSRKVGALEKVCQELLERAKTKDLRVKGPVRLPTKSLKVTTRKTPCGEGSKTWDTYEMRIHKRLIDLNAPTEVVKQIIVNIEAGVEVEVTIAA
ncbi:MAG: hypothetical protein L6R40_002824 [Gallowayella cf. fulva]|nr:MAG: hypothetical protein L6R40_002824 [Xanthomendoza cf. fulva]